MAIATNNPAKMNVSLFPTELTVSNEVLLGAISVFVEEVNRNGNSFNIDENVSTIWSYAILPIQSMYACNWDLDKLSRIFFYLNFDITSTSDFGTCMTVI